jgi:DNA-binding PadR family transcriptional regulator
MQDSPTGELQVPDDRDAAATTELIADGGTSLDDLTGFKRDILVVLAERPRIGMEILHALEEWYDEPVHHGRLYPNISDLVEAGLVYKRPADNRADICFLTEAGTALLEEYRTHLSEALDTEAAMEVPAE